MFNKNEVGLTGAGDSAVGIPFISRDPPIHTQYRKFVMPALVPARLGDIEQRVDERVAGLLAKVPLGETIDLVPLLSAPLPLLTLAELLGLPADIWPKLNHWTNAFVGEDDPEFRQSPESTHLLDLVRQCRVSGVGNDRETAQAEALLEQAKATIPPERIDPVPDAKVAER